jgi:hypothetical protein
MAVLFYGKISAKFIGAFKAPINMIIYTMENARMRIAGQIGELLTKRIHGPVACRRRYLLQIHYTDLFLW